MSGPSICGLDCCGRCPRKDQCGGCVKTGGHPFGGSCIAARWVKEGGLEGFRRKKRELVEEFNSLGIENLHVEDLNLLNGFYVNLEYPLPGGQSAKFLGDNDVYLGNQVEIPGSDRCRGLVAGEEFLLVCEYGCGGEQPRILVYKKR